MAGQYAGEFAQRLEFTESNYREHRDILLNFILNYHKLISRYEVLRKRETEKRLGFTMLSLALLVGVPLLMVKLASHDSNIAEATAMLTGLFAVHKSLSSWLDKRKVIGNFWNAECELKTKLYAFEDKWKGQATQNLTENGSTTKKLKDDFLKEAHAAICDAHAILRDEQAKFFDTVTYPSIDLAEMLKEAGGNAKALVSAPVSPELNEREKDRQVAETLSAALAAHKDKVAGMEAEIKQRLQLIEKKRQALQSASQEDGNALKLEIKTHQGKIRQAEDDLVLAKGQLEVLQRSKPV